MIIKSLTLRNFRQFMGEQKIEFSTDPEKKATLLIAKNATGKTTLLQAFSWILYGEAAGLKSILNIEMKNEMAPNSRDEISGIIVLEHLGTEYSIKRISAVTKSNSKAKVETSTLAISYTDGNGIAKELRGYEADAQISEIVPKDLFPYFFFQGENIEAIGEEIAKGKSGNNGKFVNAIRGMLGFNWLYNEQNDLKAVIKDYQREIAENSTDKRTGELQEKVLKNEEKAEAERKYLVTLKESVEALRKEKKEVSEEILNSGNVAGKQKESIDLGVEIQKLENQQKEKRKTLFSDFSSRGYSLLGQKLIESTLEFLDNNGGDISKGIPGMDASALQYVLDGNLNGKCFCGQDISEECRCNLQELIKYLPPNNLGAEISKFEEIGKLRAKVGQDLFDKHSEDEKRLRELHTEIDNARIKKKNVDDEIRDFPDISKKKQREYELELKISRIFQEIGVRETNQGNYENLAASARKELESFKSTDLKVAKLREYANEAEHLYNVITKYCTVKENEKREALEKAINEIFATVFDVKVRLDLNTDYSMTLHSDKYDDLVDFQNSTSQDAILAFSFIGGIIKLAREKVVDRAQDKLDEGDLSDMMEVEPYPLVMDAPSSSFDTDRIESFCRIMPNIAEQVIFFIKDTDGNYVKKDLENIIGKEYTMSKSSQYVTEIKEVI